MKKVIPIIIILGVSIFFFLNREGVKYETSEEVQESTKSDSAPKNANVSSESVKAKSRNIQKDQKQIPITEREIVEGEGSVGEKTLSEEEMEELDEYFDQIEEEWESKVKDLFINQMGMTQEDVDDYYKMKEGYEEDKVEIYQEFHEEMVAKHGDSYQFKPSEEMTSFEKKLREDYQNALRKRIGEENYKLYLETIDSFNERVRREQKPEYPALHLEF
ncbi:MAG: hypothetical protein GY909_17000 [Oligoflexia bacterium]|nr:hypothetical protein [Oligoflexia bacterium]